MRTSLILFIAVFLLVAPNRAHGKTGTPVSYVISENHRCMGKGEEECVTRFPSVTNDGGDTPPKVGETPLRNPFNPSACAPKPPTKSKIAAYSSLGLDPGNPGNYKKYNLKKLKPIEGWPGEFHFEIDDNLKAWRSAMIVRANKAGAKTLEADNSDIPGYDLAKIAAQLNHECQMHKAFGEPCPLKNNFPILRMLQEKPKFWFIETGQGNQGTRLIEQAKSSGVEPNDIYIVHYGPVSQQVCDMIPGAHVVFSATQGLKGGELTPCPNAPRVPPPQAAPPPPPSQCVRNDPPPEERQQDQPPPQEVAQEQPQNPPSTITGSPQPPLSPSLPSPAAAAASQPAPYYPASYFPSKYNPSDAGVVPYQFSGKTNVNPVSDVTRSDDGKLPATAETVEKFGAPQTNFGARNSGAGGFGDSTDVSKLNGAGGGAGSAAASRAPAALTYGSYPGSQGGGGSAPAKTRGVPGVGVPGSEAPAAKADEDGNQSGGGGGGDTLSPFAAKKLGYKKLDINSQDVQSAAEDLAEDLQLEEEPAPEQASTDEGSEPSLFERVHAMHERKLGSGMLERF